MIAQRREPLAQGEQEAAPARMSALKRHMDALPDPGVPFNVWPNPPWNTVPYEWNAIYPPDSQEHKAQLLARYALATGLQYNTTPDKYGRPGRAQDKQEQPAQARGSEQEPKREPLHVANGILTDSGLVFMRDGKPARVPIARPEHIGDILQLCLSYRLRTIWVLASCSVSDLATEDFIEAARPGWEISGLSMHKVTGFCKFVSGWKKHASERTERKTCYVGFAAHNERWDFEDIASPLLLLAALAYLEDALHVPALFSPSNVGKKLMELETSGARAGWARPSLTVRDIPAITDTGAQDCVWKRPLHAQEQGAGMFLLAYDKNAMYPASCTSVLLGSGEPEHRERPGFDVKKPLPGVWHITISGISRYPALPHPTDGVTSGWFWSYTVKACIEMGFHVDISEAWVWPEHHTILRAWAERLRDARKALKTDTSRYSNAQARALAYEKSKDIGRHAIGLLDHKPDEARGAHDYDWYRPDWNALVKDNARYLLLRRLIKMFDMGYSPVGVHVDCIFYVLPTNDVTALPGMLDRSQEQGGFKVKYARLGAVPVTGELVDWFENPFMEIGEINQRLLQLNRVQEGK